MLLIKKEINKYGYKSNTFIGGGKESNQNEITYRKSGTKSKQRAACIKVNQNDIELVLMFLNRIDFNQKAEMHQEYLNNAPEHIKNVLVSGGNGNCIHCPGKSNCNNYHFTIDGKLIEMCGASFTFHNPNTKK